MIKIDHFYVTVTDLTKAIIFYEGVLQIPITHREGNRWADFSDGNAVYFGIYNAKVDGEKFQTGNSPTLCLKTKDIDIERGRIQRLTDISSLLTIGGMCGKLQNTIIRI